MASFKKRLVLVASIATVTTLIIIVYHVNETGRARSNDSSRHLPSGRHAESTTVSPSFVKGYCNQPDGIVIGSEGTECL